MSTISIHQSQYIPWTPYLKKIYQSDIFVVMDNVQFQRRGVQNRNSISDGINEIRLTIPVSKKQSEAINEKLIAQNWGKKHFKSLQSCYGKSLNWSRYNAQLEQLYSRNYKTLHDLNMAFLNFIFQVIDLPKPEVIELSSLSLTSNKSQLILDICKKMNAQKYLSGFGAKDYLDLEEFSKENIEVIFEQSKPAQYQPIGKSFIAGLSILDMLFHCPVKEVQQYLLNTQSSIE